MSGSVVYIRATDLRPLYILYEKHFCRVRHHLSPNKCTAYKNYFIRVGDFVEIEFPGPKTLVLVTLTTVFTEEVSTLVSLKA